MINVITIISLFFLVWVPISGIAFAQKKEANKVITINLSNHEELDYPLHLITLPPSPKKILSVKPTITMRLGDPYKGKASYKFNIPKSNKYQIWALVHWTDSCHNSFWIESDDKTYLLGNNKIYKKWHWIKGPIIKFHQGTSSICLKAREANVMCAQIQISPAHLDFTPVEKSVELTQSSEWHDSRLARQLLLLALMTKQPSSYSNYLSQIIPIYERPQNENIDISYFLSYSTNNFELDLAYAKCLCIAGQSKALAILTDTFNDSPYIFRFKHLLARCYLNQNNLVKAREIYIDIISTGEGICDLNDAYEALSAIDLTLSGNNQVGLLQTQGNRYSRKIKQHATVSRKHGNLYSYTCFLNQVQNSRPNDINNTMFLMEMYFKIKNFSKLDDNLNTLSKLRSNDKGLKTLRLFLNKQK